MTLMAWATRKAALQDGRVVATACGAGLLAVLLAAYPLTFPHLLSGVHGYASGAGYDDGVYLSVALRLVHGGLPYRDFVFVHPPGIAWLLAPFAMLDQLVGTRDVLVLARLATVLVAGANSVLASLAVRHRGVAASLVAGVLLAGFPGAYNADHTLLLEPWLVLPCLLAFVTLFPRGHFATTSRRLLLAGLFGGFAGSVKVWAILVILPLMLACILGLRRRALPFLAGLVAGFIVPCLPFLVTAPGAFVRDVFVAQANRSTAGAGLDAATRIGIMSGLKHFGEVALSQPVVGLALAGTLVVGTIMAARWRQLTPADRTAAAVALVVVAGLFAPVQFYDHYAYFSAAFLAVLIGVCGGLVSDALVGLVRRRFRGAWPPVLAGAAMPVIACAAVVLALPTGIGGARSYFADATDPGESVKQAILPGSCVVFDDPVLLLVGDRLGQSRRDCPQLVDPFGLWLTEAGGSLPHLGGPFPEPFVQQWSIWLRQADYVVLSTPGSDYIPFSPDLVRQFNASFRLVSAEDHAYVFARIS